MKLFEIICFVFAVHFCHAQSINRNEFFENDSPATLSISVNLKNIDQPKQVDVKRPAIARLTLPNDSSYEAPIELHARGKSRLAMCDPPPLMLYFKTNTPGTLSKLGKLKLVWACNSTEYYDQLILKEYLIYKMYNLLTPYSFRVRLLNVQVSDSSAKNGKVIKRKGFLIENIDDVAKRYDCKEFQDTSLMPNETNQFQYALVTIFQYMIANTDWSIGNYQNIKMIVPNGIPRKPPLIIPYDFDYSGLVDAEYAVPYETIPIENVRQRYNRATRLNMVYIDSATQVILLAKERIFSLIENMPELKPAIKREMSRFLNEFYLLIKNKNEFNLIFLKQ